MKKDDRIRKAIANLTEKMKEKGFFKDSLRENRKLLIIIGIILAVIITAVIIFAVRGSKNAGAISEMMVPVTRGNVQVKIEGSGSVEPIERYDIMPLAKGTILEAPFEEGDEVLEGDILYTIDYTDVSTQIEKARSNLEKLYDTQEDLQEDVAALKLYAPASGKLTGFTLKENDNFSTSGGKVGEITDVLTLVAKIPFSKAQIENIRVGQSAVVNIEQFMQSVDGTVASVSNVGYALGTGAILYDVEIHINAKQQNCEGIKEGTKVTANVKGYNGKEQSPSYGEISFPDSVLLMAKSGGTVSKLYAKNGSWVEKGQLIAVFENKALTQQLRSNALDIKDAVSSLKSAEETLDDYIIKSQIDGVVITKNYKKGDNLQLGNSSSTVVMTVADMSRMIFYIDADELDIAKIKIGQSVAVEADALPGKEFDAQVTQIATEGTSTNGVATYKVKVTINNPEGLMPGMNVTGEIIVEESRDTLLLPTSAVIARDGRYYVYRSTKKNNKRENDNEKSASIFINAYAAPEDAAKANDRIIKQLEANKPENTEIVEITIGVNNDEYIEVVDGLNEGDIIVVTGVAATSNSAMNAMMNMGRQMNGGMGGGMPSGMRMPSGEGMPQGGSPSGRN